MEEKIKITPREAVTLYNSSPIVKDFNGEKLRYAINKQIIHLKSIVNDYRSKAQINKNDFFDAYKKDYDKLMEKKLENEELKTAHEELQKKHEKFFKRNQEIQEVNNANADIILEMDAHYISSNDISQEIRQAMTSEQELFLISIGVLREPVAPSAGLIGV